MTEVEPYWPHEAHLWPGKACPKCGQHTREAEWRPLDDGRIYPALIECQNEECEGTRAYLRAQERKKLFG